MDTFQYPFLVSLVNSGQQQTSSERLRMAHWLRWAVNSSQAHTPLYLPAGHPTSSADALSFSCVQQPSSGHKPWGPALGTCQILHTSQQISWEEEKSYFQITSCGFTYTGQRWRLSPTALPHCCAPHRLAHFHYCGEEISTLPTTPFFLLLSFLVYFNDSYLNKVITGRAEPG